MQLQRLLSYTRKAVDEYEMIQEGDHIAVGISGGKDSLTLLYALHGLRRFYPKHFELSAITVDLGFEDFDLAGIRELCRELDVPYKIVKSDIYDILFNIRKESNPCSLCAKMRKGALNQAIKEMGCNKVAYAHHKDDIIETMLLSLIFEGRFHSFSPRTYLDRMDLTVIRPLMYVDEMDVIGFKNKYDLPVVKSKCPVDGYTKRQYAKELLRQINLEHPGARERMFHAILNGNISGWPDRIIRVPNPPRKGKKNLPEEKESVRKISVCYRKRGVSAAAFVPSAADAASTSSGIAFMHAALFSIVSPSIFLNSTLPDATSSASIPLSTDAAADVIVGPMPSPPQTPMTIFSREE